MSTQGCVLIVDDKEANRDLLMRRLRSKGYAVMAASSGREALQLVEQQPFDLVLLDIEMPEMNGLEVLATIRETHSLINLPVIMVTCRDQGGDVVAALQVGANDHVAKPINFPVLFARIQTQLAVQRGGVEPAAGMVQSGPPPELGHEAPEWLVKIYGDAP